MPKAKNLRKPAQKKPVNEKNVTLLAVMGILGLIFVIMGVITIIAFSLFLGVALIITGMIIYVAFVVIEKKAKLI